MFEVVQSFQNIVQLPGHPPDTFPRKLYERLRALPHPGLIALEGLQYRLRKWLPEVDCSSLSHL
eukprot:8065737-Pyramimonas_sp.AAC.1